MKTIFKRVAIVLLCMILAIPSAMAYIQCALNCNGKLVHIFVPDNLTPEQQKEFMADALDRLCDQDVEAPDE